MLFCVSLMWRVLHHMVNRDKEPLQDELVGQIGPVYQKWKDFLNGAQENPGEHEIHVFPVDLIERGDLPDDPGRINLYLTRGVDIDLCSNSERAYVYAHIPYFLIFGRIYDHKPRFRAISKIRLRKGRVGGMGSSYAITTDLMNYIFDRARFVRDQVKSMSERQCKKIETAIGNDPERARNSPAFEAGFRDYLLSERKR